MTAALLFFGIYPVEGLEPGVPASPFTRSVAVGIAQELLNENGDGFEISSDSIFSGSVLPFSAEEIDVKKGAVPHSLKLKNLACENHRSDGKTWVTFELVQMGLGGEDSWSAMPREEYRIEAKPMTFSYILRPLAN